MKAGMTNVCESALRLTSTDIARRGEPRRAPGARGASFDKLRTTASARHTLSSRPERVRAEG
jgi:hypothetical protein